MNKVWALLKQYGYTSFMTVYMIWASRFNDNIHSGWFRFACGIIVFYWLICLLDFLIQWPLIRYRNKLLLEVEYLRTKHSVVSDTKQRESTISIKINNKP